MNVKTVEVDLEEFGRNGNAFAILAVWRRSARTAGWNQEEIQTVLDEARTSDYDHLLQTMCKYSEFV